MHVRLGRGGVEVEVPDLPEKHGGIGWWSAGELGKRVAVQHSITSMLQHYAMERFERIHHPVAPGEADQGTVIHGGHRRGGPGAVEDVRGDMLIVACFEAAGVLVEHHEARRVGGADVLVGIVHAGAAVEVEVIAVNQDGAVGRIV
ncbi:MAG: hypothetical protein NT154_42430 [Verrucomicrobia bacterium]|nr:hypothetical protein [Verrucomicrobiota bacterium]